MRAKHKPTGHTGEIYQYGDEDFFYFKDDKIEGCEFPIEAKDYIVYGVNGKEIEFEALLKEYIDIFVDEILEDIKDNQC